ncbi:MAG TPA: hypothetical protein VF681_00100 [Abditibacteriaceae bacterium]|jgi:hypothetical protein
MPINLVPSCADCNKEKLSHVPEQRNQQLFHPYFDRLPREKWLNALIEYSDAGPIVLFEAQPPSSWDALLASRVVNHFEQLKLGSLYSIHGTAEIPGIRARLQKLLDTNGPTGVKEHLEEEWRTRASDNPNSWQAATYEALARDSTFYGGSFG